ncbi:mannitol dehydrogenase family protein [Sphaerochaeta sp.]|uniref:mannitol dehydrogenase family protein n=1 Tax=Sphaerochaeta sp. TaxID=1972642 RepID=UPI002A360E7C|nr:mannitol dehydrogenase family protein [Sphaerochaeta sp.]MDX9984952.1 mannitol dehydrogenase family protein [Sphaerochaeta sp.]
MKIANRTLELLKSKGIAVPTYDRLSLRPSYVHIGLGHFHRSHFLTYMDKLLNDGFEKNGVFEVDIIPSNPTIVEGLKQQDYLYSVLSLDNDGSKMLRINGPIVGYANQTENPEMVHEMLSSPNTSLITLTITEKGYAYLDEKEHLDWNNPSIARDITTNYPPISAIGCLANALRTRFGRKSPVTIMSCDNVPENGVILKRCIVQFCEKKYPEITDWVSSEIAFPCTMVDRITPGTSEQDIMELRANYDLEDCCPVHCEDYIQWVIEDNICTEIPDFAKAGALVVDDVKPYELMKIRLLNGSHSALAYPAYMMGIRMVHEAALDPVLGPFIRDVYMKQMAATLTSVPGVDLDVYMDKLISRFSNRYIADTILRLAEDGSKKISNFILRPLEEGLDAQNNVDSAILVLAIWQYFFLFKDQNNNSMPINDPKKESLLAVSSDVRAFLRTAGLAESAFRHDSLFQKMDRFLTLLKTYGVRETLTMFSNEV